MKTPFLLLAFLLAMTTTQSQTIDETLITGQWKVKKAIALKDADKPETKELVAGFQKATYHFNADHSFAFETKSNSKMMQQLEKLFQKNQWIFDKKKKQIKVGLKKEGYSNITFIISVKDKKIIFLIDDAQIEMVMKKQ
ncbi:hypothetical protein IVB69_11355 [Flavobacterium sp. J49]|uniref:DUF5004 domain-containing protein n=1 Tax=Flavobacterium sp. J49 TaxID=2718534 RepID=UPI0015949FC2|nr:DUF5004 domain-containing protein [Flavobacterium sp. J49]MBF6642079.1 hypothetical protein [Flavobacterium sp. J49]NIC03326.1 hypothetical protein [Flavobacterium sp. J49]